MASYGDWTRTRMIRDIPEAPRVINVIQGRRRQAGVSTEGGTMAQIRRGNNNLGEDGRATVGSGRMGSSLELREGHQSTVVTMVSARVSFHASDGESGDLNTDGLQMMGMGNEGEGEQMGGRWVGGKRGGIKTKVVARGNNVGFTSQNPLVRI